MVAENYGDDGAGNRGVGAPTYLADDSDATYIFGRFSVLRRARQLLLDGQPREVGSRAFDLLLLLIDQRGEIVTKRQIMEGVWPDIYVEDTSLRVQVNTLRRVLGDYRDIIKNVPGRGYLFAADITLASGKTAKVDGPVRADISRPEPAAARTNLTRPLNQTVGRETELDELEAAIGDARLITLVGSGGIGKTRLAIEMGLRMTTAFPDGTLLVDLAPLTERPAVIGAVATALGIQLQNADSAVEVIAAAIGKQRCLLIFDNCEHLVPVAADLIDDLLERCPRLVVLATSQMTLRIAAEQVYRLNPLGIPPVEARDLTGFSAATLLIERARAADRRFAVTPGNVAGIAEICRRLDGVPLALEMAAARLPILGIEGLRAGLDERLKMLRDGVQTAYARHRTLQAMAEWSEGLLDVSEQQVFRRLGMFAGSFSLEAATAVAGTDGSDRWDTVDALSGLIDKSLVAVEGGEPPRYRLLETLRLFAIERLASSGERAMIAERHARYFAALFDRAYGDWETTPDELWLDSYQPELDNGRSALDWALAEPTRASIALVLSTGVALLLMIMRLYPEGIRHAGTALGLLEPRTPAAASGRAFRVGSLQTPGDFTKTLEFLQQAARQFRQAGDRRGLAWAVRGIGNYSSLLGQFAEADAALAEASALASAIGNGKLSAGVLMSLGLVASMRGDHAAARSPYTRALIAARENKDERMEALILSNFVMAEFGAGANERAIELSSQCLALGTRSRRRGRGIDTNAISNHASLLIHQDRASDARPYAEQVFLSCRDLGTMFLRDALLQWVQIALAERNEADAARLWGFINATPIGYPEDADPIFLRGRERVARLLEAKVSAEALASHMSEGAQWAQEQAADFAARHLVWPGRNGEQAGPS